MEMWQLQTMEIELTDDTPYADTSILLGASS